MWFVDDLLVKNLPAGAYSVFEIIQGGNRSGSWADKRRVVCAIEMAGVNDRYQCRCLSDMPGDHQMLMWTDADAVDRAILRLSRQSRLY